MRRTAIVVSISIMAVALAGGLAAMGWLWSSASASSELRGQEQLLRQELPGASIELPAHADREDHIDYAAGSVRFSKGGRDEVLLYWATDARMTTKAELRALTEPVAQTWGSVDLQEADVLVAGNRGFRFLARDAQGKTVFVASAWPCGKRMFTFNGTGAGASLEPRIRESFVCTPDPKRDGKRPAIGVELDAGPDFGSVGAPPSLGVASLDGDVITVARYPWGLGREEIRKDVIPGGLEHWATTFLGCSASSFGPLTLERGPRGDRRVWRGHGRKDNQPLQLLAVEIDCGPDQYLGMYIAPEVFPEKRGLAPLLAARCSVTPRRPPPITELARAACARGDQSACNFK